MEDFDIKTFLKKYPFLKNGKIEVEEDTKKEVYKILAKRYPFLIPANVWSGKVDESFDFSYLEGFFETGWGEIWLEYCEEVRPEFEKLVIEGLKILEEQTK